MCPCTLILFLLATIGGLVYTYLSWNFSYWKKRGVKGPEPTLVYGNIPSIVKRNRHLAFDMQELYEKYKKSGERFIGFFMTRNPQIMVIDHKLARDIMVTNFKAFRDNEPMLWVNRKLEEISGRNPFLTPGQDWKDRRADVVGGLSASKLKLAYPIVMQSCNKMIEYLKTTIAKSGNVIECKTLCYKYTIEIVADFLWGISADAFKPEVTSNPILNMSRKMLDMSFLRVGFYYISGLAPFIRKFSKNRFFPEDTDAFFSQVQKDAVEMRLRNKNDRPDYLNYLIQLQEKKNISHLDMVGHSMTVLLDGFETSASVTYHALFYLASNQAAQKRLREEIMANIDEEGRISYEALVDLPYLDQCINETIRLITPIPVFSRMCTEQIYLESSDDKPIKIDPGMTLHIPTFAFHHDSDIFANPEEYIPERFDDGQAKELNQKGCFFPFGDGPRICAGMRLGQLESKAGIFEIIRNFQLNICKETGEGKSIDPSTFIIGLAGDILLEFVSLNK